MKTVKVTFENGKSLTTCINGTDKEITDYYLKNEFNLSPYREDGKEDPLTKGKKVEFLTRIWFYGIDHHNRPRFIDDKSQFYGSTEKLFPYGESEESVLKTVSEKDITYFGLRSECEPMGTDPGFIVIVKNQ